MPDDNNQTPKKAVPRAIALAIVAALMVAALYNQYKATLTPWCSRFRDTTLMLSLSDRDKLAVLAPAYAGLIQEIRRFPPGTRFYFVPSFTDSGNTKFWWWYVYLLSRYFSYPNQLLCHDVILYGNDKNIYLERWIKGSRTFRDIPWIKERHIEQIILMRNNQVQILPLAAETSGL
jgi:hypothetical protein